MTNLDYLAAARAVELCEVIGQPCAKDGAVTAEQTDTLVNKALGVVAESGPFACGLFLLSRSGKGTGVRDLDAEATVACHAVTALVGLASDDAFSAFQPRWNSVSLRPSEVNRDKRAVIDYLLKISNSDLPGLLLVQRTWEQLLTYARYIAKSQRSKD